MTKILRVERPAYPQGECSVRGCRNEAEYFVSMEAQRRRREDGVVFVRTITYRRCYVHAAPAMASLQSQDGEK